MENTVTFLRFWIQIFGGMYGVTLASASIIRHHSCTNYSYMRALALFLICELFMLSDLTARINHLKTGINFFDIVVYGLSAIASFNLVYNYLNRREETN